eukprot:EG_transcript_18282
MLQSSLFKLELDRKFDLAPPGLTLFVFDLVMDFREYFFFQLAKENATLSPRVEEILSKYKDAKKLRDIFHLPVKRGYKHINTVMQRTNLQVCAILCNFVQFFALQFLTPPCAISPPPFRQASTQSTGRT